MQDAMIPDAQRTTKFKHCLDGKARLWYDEIIVPADWYTLMTMFCARFCIYSIGPEEWFDRWQNLKHDPSKDIEDILTDVRSLVEILGYDDQAQVMHVCNLFPTYKVTMMLIHTKEETFNFLRRMYPKPDSTGTSTGTMAASNPKNPFAMMSDTEGPLQFSHLTSTGKQVQFDSANFLEAVDKLTEAVTKLTLKANRNYSKYDQKSSYANRPRDDKGRFQKPYKPYITKG